MTKDEKIREEKRQRICDRIIAETKQEQWDIIFSKDNKLKKLRGDRSQALQLNQFLKMRLITNMIEAREKEIQYNLVGQMLSVLIGNGEIVKYMDQDDQVAYQENRVRIFLLMDALDSALNDLNAKTNSVGINGQLKMSKSIITARDDIKAWTERNTSFHQQGLDDVVYDEADRVNNFIIERVPVLVRKIERECNKRKKKAALAEVNSSSEDNKS